MQFVTEELFAFHERPDAFELLQPPWDPVAIIQPPTSLEVGTQVKLRSKVGPFWIDIVAEHVAYAKNERFVDVMLKGPFARWHHEHLFLPHAEGSILRDEIDYELQLGPLGRLVAPVAVLPRLRRMFDYRHEVTRRYVAG
ncbi:MAG TPA: cyclase [Polyangiaceae bacterium]|nr:cyclase [Polyangiaceae bacterium]